jgi:hypothetical protein
MTLVRLIFSNKSWINILADAKILVYITYVQALCFVTDIKAAAFYRAAAFISVYPAKKLCLHLICYKAAS